MPTKRIVGNKLQPPPAPKLTMIPPGVEERGAKLLTPLHPEEVMVIDSQEAYEAADHLLGRIRQARAQWKLEMYGDKDRPGPIPLQRQAMDALYALNNKFDKPMEAKETQVKAAMRIFKEAEQRLLREAEEQRQAEIRRLQQAEQDATRKAVTAQTPQLAGRFMNQAHRLEEQIEQQQAAPLPIQPAMGMHSAMRKTKKWRIADKLAFVKAVLDGTFGLEWIDVSPEGKATFNEMLKTDPDGLAAYPGIEVYEEIGIVGR